MLLPVLAVVLLEIGLRLVGYGYDTAFFKTVNQGGRRLVIPNETFSLRFFPPELARWPTGFAFAPEKPADTTRIFILGESAAMGDPQPAFGAGRYFEKLLQQRYPRHKFEVINLGVTAINSHVILPIARDCARQQGDIWLIYMGNNEMVGPFGAATVFGSQAAPLTAVRMNLAFQQTRIGQLLMSWVRKFAGKSENASWGGMQMFLKNQVPPEDRRRETVYASFEHNLRDIVKAGLTAKAKVLLSTVSVNLRDCPPFASLPNTNLSAAQRAQFEAFFAAGKSLAAQSHFREAADNFAAAAKLDPLFAESQFRWAECLLQLTNAAARERFQAACDADALPFRADTRVNVAIRELATRWRERGVVFCDAEQQLAAAGVGGVAGRESFYEHVHFNFAGNYRLARAWAEQVESMLPEPVRRVATPAWATLTDCEHLLGLTDWNRQFVVQAVLRRLQSPPLSSQFNNAERFQSAQAEELELRRRQALPDAALRTREAFERLIAATPGDAALHEGRANFLEAIGDRGGAVAAYRRMLEQLPKDFYASLQLGRLLAEQGSPELGVPYLEDTTRLRPSIPEGWHELGSALAAQGRFPAALECMLRAEQLRPQDPGNLCYTGKVLAKMQRRAEAIARYRQALQLRPAFWEARFELAGELAFNNQTAQALEEYLEVLKVNPGNAVTHANVGVLLVRLNRLDDAIARFEEALRLDPSYKVAQDYLQQVRARRATQR